MPENAPTVTVRWVDSTIGAINELNHGAEFATAGTQTFTTPGNNVESATDWDLVAATTSPAANASGERRHKEQARDEHHWYIGTCVPIQFQIFEPCQACCRGRIEIMAEQLSAAMRKRRWSATKS
jgi:hypothetical protein